MVQVGREVKIIRAKAAAGNEEKDGMVKAETQTGRAQQKMGVVGGGWRVQPFNLKAFGHG